MALLGIGASVVAPRDSRRHFYVLPALACLTFLVPYAVLSPENSQARFLMPAHALLMVPAAYFIVWAATQTRNTALPAPYSRWARVEVRSKRVTLQAAVSPRGS